MRMELNGIHKASPLLTGHWGAATRVALCFLAVMTLLAVVARPGHAALGDTVRASVSSSGAEGLGDSNIPSISADGRYVAFSSSASELVPGDTNDASDIFVHDVQTGETTRVSTDGSGNEGNDRSFTPSISDDARYVTFYSYASNLVSDDTNDASDIFVHDVQTGETTRVSTDGSGDEANGRSEAGIGSISADGRYVTFSSTASNLVSGDGNEAHDIFVKDLQTSETKRVSTDSSGNQVAGMSVTPSISDDGRYVAFSSYAWDLVPGDTNNSWDVFVKDLQTGETTRASVGSSGDQWAGSDSPAISGDGRHVAFRSDLGANNTGAFDIYVHDLGTGKTDLVSVNMSGDQGNYSGGYPSINHDGRYVAFSSGAQDLVPDDANIGGYDVFVRDVQTGKTELVDRDSSGRQGAFGNYSAEQRPSISADGRYVAFDSYQVDLVANDANSRQDVFIHHWGGDDTTAPTTTLTASPAPDAAGWNTSDVTVDLTATDNPGGYGVEQITYSATGAQQIASNTVAGDKAQVSIATEGTTTITYFATDRRRNAADKKTLTIKLDKGDPNTTINTGPGSLTKDATPTFTFGGSDAGAGTNLLYSYKVVASGVAPGDVAWSDYSTSTRATLGGTEGLGDGLHTFYVKAKDQVGNEDGTPASRSFTVDTTAPAAPVITNPLNNSYDRDGIIALSGTAETGTAIQVFEGATPRGTPVNVGTGGAWSKTLSGVVDGSHTYTVKATDRAGNTSVASASRTVRVDTNSPSGTVTINSGASSTRSRTVTLALRATDPSPASGVSLMRFRNENTTTWSSWQAYATSKSWTLSSGAGTKTVYVQYQDRAGNVSTLARDTIQYAP